MVNWAIIGLGKIGEKHLEAINQIGDKLVMACDIDIHKTRKIPKDIEFSSSYMEMCTSKTFIEKVNNVAICTPNNLHFEMCFMCAFQGKKILCEKPLTLGSESTQFLDQSYPNQIYTVLQLRYHPEIIKLKKTAKKIGRGSITVKVYRPKSYWQSWKGDEKKSGGILFNLGIHYLDLLIYLLEENYHISSARVGKSITKGLLNFSDSLIQFHFEILNKKQNQERTLELDGKRINLSLKENLSQENLHLEVYKAFKKEQGITMKEAIKSIKLAESIKNADRLFYSK